jgi:hypothetical protein
MPKKFRPAGEYRHLKVNTLKVNHLPGMWKFHDPTYGMMMMMMTKNDKRTLTL